MVEENCLMSRVILAPHLNIDMLAGLQIQCESGIRALEENGARIHLGYLDVQRFSFRTTGVLCTKCGSTTTADQSDRGENGTGEAGRRGKGGKGMEGRSFQCYNY